MTVITLLDHKGEYVQITYPCVYKTKNGLTETWVYAVIPSMPEYQHIPLPVFTEWWIQ